MAVVVDATFVLALADGADPHHAAAVAWLDTEDEDLVTTPLVVGEVDAALAGHAGAREAFHRDLLANAYTVRWWADALVETTTIARREERLSLAQASLVAAAARVGTHRIASFASPVLGALTALDGDPFVLLP